MLANRPSLFSRVISSIEKGVKYLLFSFFSLFIHSKKISSVDKTQIKSILVIRQHNQLGDMLCAVPLLHALRKTFPSAHIALLARPINSEILDGSPFVDEVLVYQKQKFWTSPFALLTFLHRMRKRNFDLELTPATVAMSVSSDVLAFLSKSKIRIGPNSLNGRRNVTRYMYNVRVDLAWKSNPLVHQTQRNLDTARVLSLESVPHEIYISLSEKEIENGKAILKPRTKKHPFTIGFHPGAAKISNRWDALRFAEVANRCAEILGAFIVVTAGPDDEEPLREMLLNMPNEHLVLKNESIRLAASVISQCRIFVTNDTGIMHVAAGVGTSVLSLFGPTDPLLWAPNGNHHRFIVGRNGKLDDVSAEKVWSVLNEILRG